DELAAARRLAERAPALDAQRLGGRLQRRGFASGVVRAVVRERAAAQQMSDQGQPTGDEVWDG
ncbi:MAG: hypothetical protein WAM30_15515, partial [Candidatus Dormiibacterota bacterium]